MMTASQLKSACCTIGLGLIIAGCLASLYGIWTLGRLLWLLH